jgi:hypothetical protein
MLTDLISGLWRAGNGVAFPNNIGLGSRRPTKRRAIWARMKPTVLSLVEWTVKERYRRKKQVWDVRLTIVTGNPYRYSTSFAGITRFPIINAVWNSSAAPSSHQVGYFAFETTSVYRGRLVPECSAPAIEIRERSHDSYHSHEENCRTSNSAKNFGYLWMQLLEYLACDGLREKNTTPWTNHLINKIQAANPPTNIGEKQ